MGLYACCSEGTEGKSLGINPGNKNVKEVYLNLSHKVRGQPDKKVAVSLSAGEMMVIKRLSEVSIPDTPFLTCRFHVCIRLESVLHHFSAMLAHQWHMLLHGHG